MYYEKKKKIFPLNVDFTSIWIKYYSLSPVKYSYGISCKFLIQIDTSYPILLFMTTLSVMSLKTRDKLKKIGLKYYDFIYTWRKREKVMEKIFKKFATVMKNEP